MCLTYEQEQTLPLLSMTAGGDLGKPQLLLERFQLLANFHLSHLAPTSV